MEHVFKIICVNFGAILMFHYGVMGIKLKQVAQIWHSEIKVIKNNIVEGTFYKINILCINVSPFLVNILIILNIDTGFTDFGAFRSLKLT